MVLIWVRYFTDEANDNVINRVVNDGIDLGAGVDTLETYGAIDLSGANLNGIENFVGHSDVTMTEGQFNSFASIVFEGSGSHTLTIVDEDGKTDEDDIAVLDMSKLVLKEGSGNLTVIDADGNTELDLSGVHDESEDGDIVFNGESYDGGDTDDGKDDGTDDGKYTKVALNRRYYG